MMENKMAPDIYYTETSSIFDKYGERTLQDWINLAKEKHKVEFYCTKEKEVVKLKLYD